MQGHYERVSYEWYTVCRVFVEESLRQEGRFSDQLEQDVSGLQQALGLGTQETSTLRDEISSKIYRSVSSWFLDLLSSWLSEIL